jgi:DnaJ-class molecular chaperone
MKKNKKSTLISKPDIMPCWKCEGSGKLYLFKGLKDAYTYCDLCNGSGVWIENHYIVIDEVNKISIDTDTGA